MKLASVAGIAMAIAMGSVPALAQVPPESPTQTTPPTDPMQTGPDQPPISNTMTGNTSAPATAPALSSADQRQWDNCKKKSADAMMKMPSCVTLLQQHPDLQNDIPHPR